MRMKQIEDAVAADPLTAFAVRVPNMVYGRRDGSKIVRGHVVKLHNGRADVSVHGDEAAQSVRPTNFIDTWSNYTIDRLHETALHMDSQRDDRIEYERARAERNARIEKFLPAFAGIKVQPEGTANFERDDVDLSERLRRSFIDNASAGSMFTAEDFERIAERIDALSRQVLDAASGWTTGPAVVDTGAPQVDPLDAARASIASLDTGPTEDDYEQGYRQGVQDALAELSS